MLTNNKREILGFSSSPKVIKTIAMLIINVLQDFKKGDIVVAIGVLWLMVCERFNVNEADYLAIAYRMRNETFDNKHDHQFRAIQEYMKNEL